jgi:hypothetical protein
MRVCVMEDLDVLEVADLGVVIGEVPAIVYCCSMRPASVEEDGRTGCRVGPDRSRGVYQEAVLGEEELGSLLGKSGGALGQSDVLQHDYGRPVLEQGCEGWQAGE